MIELTPEQHAALENGETLVRDAATNETYVLVRQGVYDRLKKLVGYDDSPWSDEERELLAWEAGKVAGWDNMDEYDN
jgi:hypothetical protein